MKRAPAWAIIPAALICWAYLIAVGISVIKNPTLAVVLVAVPAILAVSVMPEEGEPQ